MARRTQTIPNDIRERVLQVMDSLGGDDFAYYNIDPKSIKVGTDRSKIRFYMKVLVDRSSRTSASSRTIAALRQKGLEPRVDDTTPNRIDINAIPGDANKIIRLEIKPTGGGSGAGARETARNEACQALYCALRWMGGGALNPKSISRDDLEEAYKDCDLKMGATSLSLDFLLDSDTDWLHSHVKGANELHTKYGSKDYTFHRGSSTVTQIENVYKECNKASGGYFSDINKWSPADIYFIHNDFDINTLKSCANLDVLNTKMLELFDSKTLIGISLKKITGTAHHSVKNHAKHPKNVDAISYKGYTSSFEAIDMYIKWGNGAKDQIQFRNTGGDKLSWQGEIKGLSAAQGKVGGGVVDSILSSLGHSTLGLKTQHERLKTATNPNNKTHSLGMTKKIFEYCKTFNVTGFQAARKDAMMDKISHQNHSWRYSKYINFKLLSIIESMSPTEKTEFVQALYFYAASQSKKSCVYAKVE